MAEQKTEESPAQKKKNTRIIVFEGGEGVGKSTAVARLAKDMVSRGFSVLLTGEPGSRYSPLTMEFRKLMLSKEYESQMTLLARELTSQAARSVHLEKVILPALGIYDFVICDRSIYSGLAYAQALGHDIWFLTMLMDRVIPKSISRTKCIIYHDVVYLKTNDVKGCLQRAAAAKQEFAAGDVMEGKPITFHEQVHKNFDDLDHDYGFKTIVVDHKTTDHVYEEILQVLYLTV